MSVQKLRWTITSPDVIPESREDFERERMEVGHWPDAPPSQPSDVVKKPCPRCGCHVSVRRSDFDA